MSATQTETIALPTIPSEVPENEIQDSRPPEVKWMYPKILSAGVSFFVAGVNDGSLGSLIPYVIRTYSIGTNMVAVLQVYQSQSLNEFTLTCPATVQHLADGS